MSFTPGPNNIMAMNNARNVGFKNGLGFCFGGFFGGLVVMTLGVLFSTFLYSYVPKIQFPMKLFTAAYMVYLIIIILLPSENKKTETRTGNFLMGFLMTVINPKVVLFSITVMTTYITPYYKEIFQLTLFIFLLSFIGFSSMVCWSLCGSLFDKIFKRHGKIINIIMVILLLYCIITLFL
jgi:threonine/homoserine/homoserine lactone efflux protein